MRAKNLQLADVDATLKSKKLETTLSRYRQARSAGLQPDFVSERSIDQAWKTSDTQGSPYRGDKQ